MPLVQHFRLTAFHCPVIVEKQREGLLGDSSHNPGADLCARTSLTTHKSNPITTDDGSDPDICNRSVTDTKYLVSSFSLSNNSDVLGSC